MCPLDRVTNNFDDVLTIQFQIQQNVNQEITKYLCDFPEGDEKNFSFLSLKLHEVIKEKSRLSNKCISQQQKFDEMEQQQKLSDKQKIEYVSLIKTYKAKNDTFEEKASALET